MNRFGPDPLTFFESVYLGEAPWDIGRAQPAMVSLLNEYPPQGPVLDVGCGSGDLAVYLAEQGIEALGIDFVEEAIAQANAKKKSLPPDVAERLDFRVADGLNPTGLNQTFGAVVDSGFYHLFDPEECALFAEELAHVIRPGGRYYLHEFAVTFPVPNVPRQVTEEEIRDLFTVERGWRVHVLREAEFLSQVAPVPAILACIEYVGGRGD